ncbi:MAG: ATP-binding protein [Thermodesulfobacteriota bacterium]|nr:ATP-binding protein [Thermodesulfobacteriota bacterium]
MVKKPTYEELEQRIKELEKEYLDLKQTEIKQKEVEKLMDNDKRYRILFDSAPDGVHLLDLKGNIIDCSLSATEILGYPKEEIIGKHITYFMTPSSISVFIEKFPQLKAFKHAEGEIQLVKKDGKVIEIWRKGVPLRGSEGEFMGVLVYDRYMTEMKLLQDQSVRSERLAATGQLAVYIAHEINSPLQAITFILNTLGKDYVQDKEFTENIGLLKGAFNSIRNTIRNLLDLNRPGQDKKQQTRINAIIEKTVALIQSQLKKNKIKACLDLSSEIPDISASPQQLNHVLLNLFSNAIEAMTGISKSQNGRMSLKTGREINVKTNLSNGNIIIKVADNGPGISKDDLEHMFDPFYTRKKQMGLGIGLSVCNDIIENHGGMITAGNAPDGGAVFTIKLPCLTQSREDAKKRIKTTR